LISSIKSFNYLFNLKHFRIPWQRNKP